MDALSSAMLFVVTTVSLFVRIYSTEYTGSDSHLCRFLCYISFFTFFVNALVTPNNFIQLFFGWEGLGPCSSLLLSLESALLGLVLFWVLSAGWA